MTTETLASSEAGIVPATSSSEQPATATTTDTSTTTAPDAGARTGIGGAFDRAKASLSEGMQTPPPGAQSGEGDSADTEGRDTEKPALKPLAVPGRWTPAEKALFAQQPREIQEAWLAQDKNWKTGYDRKAEQAALATKFQDEVLGVIPEDVRASLDERQIPPAQAIGRLFQRWKLSETQPVQFIAEFMKAKNIDPTQFLPKQGEPTQQQPDPAQTLAPLIAPLLDKIARLEQGHTAWQAQQQAERDKANESAIVAFQQEKDATGASKFPYLERVAERMADLIETDPRFAKMDPRKRLEEAYQHAVLSDPDIRDEMISAEAARRAEALEKQRLGSRLASAATAKPAASSSVPSQRPTGMRAAFNRAKQQVGAG